MKLHIVLDSKSKVSFTENDIVLVTDNNHIHDGFERLFHIDYSLINESDEIYRGINDWFDKNENTEGIKNSAYNAVFRHIFGVLFTIDSIIKHFEINTIVLYGGSNHIYAAAKYAEGEGEKKHYKTNWLVNYIIQKKYNKIFSITWLYKKPTFLFYCHHVLRYYFYLFRMFVTSIQKKRNIKKNGHNHEDCKCLSIVDLPLQYNHLISVFSKFPKDEYGLFSLDYNLAKSQDNIEYIPKLSIRDVINIIIRRKKYKRNISLPLLSIKSIFIGKELNYLNIEYQIRLQRQLKCLEGKAKNTKKTLITDMTFGMDIASCHELANLLGWDHINLQWVTMARVLYPNLNLADKFFMYSHKTYELYKNYSDSFYYYLPLKKQDDSKPNHELTLTIFMQPDVYAQDYLDYLNKLLPVIEENQLKLHLIIKPHYRQNRMSELYDIVNPYKFVSVAGMNDSCEVLLKNTSIALSMHSSVIFEALINNVCCLIYNPKGKYNDSVYNNDICYPMVNFVITDAIETVDYIRDFKTYHKEYLERRSAFIEKYNCKLDLEKLIQ